MNQANVSTPEPNQEPIAETSPAQAPTPAPSPIPASGEEPTTLAEVMAAQLEKKNRKPAVPSVKTKPEVKKEKIDVKATVRKFIKALNNDRRFYKGKNLFEESPWLDPDNDWKETDVKWEDGFEEYVEKKILKGEKIDLSKFKEYVEKIKRLLEKTDEKQDPEKKAFLRGQLEVTEKMLGLFGVQSKEKTSTEYGANQEAVSLWSWENIKKVARNIWNSIFGVRKKVSDTMGWNNKEGEQGAKELQQEVVDTAPQSPGHNNAELLVNFGAGSEAQAANDTKPMAMVGTGTPPTGNDNAIVPAAAETDMSAVANDNAEAFPIAGTGNPPVGNDNVNAARRDV